MGMFDDLGSVNPEAMQQAKPTRGRFIKEGYVDWEDPTYVKTDPVSKVKEIVGVMLPPYASYLQERIAAFKAGQPFNIPFYLQVGLHAMGSRNDKEKVYVSCLRDLIRANKIGSVYPMLDPTVAQMADSCPVCDSCWDTVWPKVKEHEGNKNSPEYKTYKDSHRQLCPQGKYVFNFLPAGTATPLKLEAPKTLGEGIVNLHYDQMHPDLLWPYPVGQVACCWVQIKRDDKQDTTDYSVTPVYHNVPHIRDAATGQFNERLYLDIISKMADLRVASKNYVPEQADITKALAKRDKILTFSGLLVDRNVAIQVANATAGIGAPVIAQPPPIMALGVPGAAPMAAPTPSLPPAVAGLPPTPPPTIPSQPAPVASVPAATPALPPSTPAPTPMTAPAATALPATPPPAPVAPPTTPANVTPQSNQAFDVLQNLLGNNKP